jgi:uncharacterized protein
MRSHHISRLSLLLALCIGTSAVFAAKPLRYSVVLDGRRFSVEIADTDAARERGLMFRTQLADGHGMLFVYPDAQPRFFWMKNTLIPLDILFFDAHHRLINVSADTPPCKADPCTSYASAAPAQYVLELNAGAAANLGIKKADIFKLH